MRGSLARGYFPPAWVEGVGARLGILPTAAVAVAAVAVAAVAAQRGRKAENGFIHETGLELRSRIKNGVVLREISLRVFFVKIRNPRNLKKSRGAIFQNFEPPGRERRPRKGSENPKIVRKLSEMVQNRLAGLSTSQDASRPLSELGCYQDAGGSAS